MLRVLDLFSGIGGFSLGLERTGGFETVAFCEIEEYPRAVLRKHWPDVPIYEDVRKINDTDRLGRIDCIVGGYPCQPFSHAGKREGAKDDRHLWPEMHRIVASIRPSWVIAENVAGHVSMGLDQVLSDLEGEGYTTVPLIIPACAVGALHRRDRVWIVANAKRSQWRSCEPAGHDADRQTAKRKEAASGVGTPSQDGDRRYVADANGKGLQGQRRGEEPSRARKNGGGQSRGGRWWLPEPNVGGGIDGLPAELDGDLSDEARARASEMLRRVWCGDEAEALRQTLGGFERVQKAEILFAFLCEYEERENTGRLAMECAEARQECLRGVWQHIEFARSPLQSRHYGQHAREFADALRKLSRDTSSLYPAVWATGQWEDGVQRVATGVPKRVDRLKALGNAVVPQIPEMIGYAILEAENECLRAEMEETE